MQRKAETRHVIKKVQENSIAMELELEVGDELLRINGQKIKDVFDYHYLINDEFLTLIVKKKNGEEWELEIEKNYEDDLGIEFEEGLMDQYRSCKNKCIFCFIDQMPSGMRDTLYFKDDDARLSFLQGNYITLTNMSDEDVERICFYKLSPINISVHTTNKELRQKMLHNRFAGDALEKLQKFYDAGIEMNGQVVLCKGYNDGEELDKTISDLMNYLPYMKSVSVVPVGLTKFREKLAPLEKFNKEDSIKLIEQIEGWQAKIKRKYGTRFIFASDEWYITAERELPKEEAYEGYPQIENGVGMVRSLEEEFKLAYSNLLGDDRRKKISMATGVLAAPLVTKLSETLTKKYPNIEVNVYTIINDFFGPEITVAGLLTGQDIIKQLSDKDLGEYLVLPNVLLRDGENVLLDDLTVNDIEKALQTPIRIVKSEGASFIDVILD
ncbi:DUF512 domain-containing protein [Clostridium sp. Marseille-P299]|uniref:DUF512 domain-containing protein n=1 Tax=Clostridium sp. Marseille-P299 TaxID=1805477 RepID=UPI0008316F65|nr:DUF512 domain-containing protein [Clostridium sp. Marseille-P299]